LKNRNTHESLAYMGNEFMTLDADRESTETLRAHWRRAYVKLVAEGPRTAALLPRYQVYGGKLDNVIAREQAIRDAQELAAAKAITADTELNRLGRRLKIAIHGGNQVDITNPRHILYFGNKTVAEALRGILGPQLDMSVYWVEKLLPKESETAFVDLLKPMIAGVDAGQEAKTAVADAQADNAKFRLDGARRQAFDEYNAMAAETFGDLVAYALAHPEWELPSDWPGSFYIHTTRDPGPQTVEDVDKILNPLMVQVKALETLRADLAQHAIEQAQAEVFAATAEAEHETAKAAEKAARKATKEAADKAEAAKKAAKKKKK
jgi:hypothetical protein